LLEASGKIILGGALLNGKEKEERNWKEFSEGRLFGFNPNKAKKAY